MEVSQPEWFGQETEHVKTECVRDEQAHFHLNSVRDVSAVESSVSTLVRVFMGNLWGI